MHQTREASRCCLRWCWGGLVGTSPHMISASVMALARLLHQFANELGGKRS